MNKKMIFIIGVIIGGIFFSCITAYATIYYEASQINYKGTTLDHAIDDLYATQNTRVSSLENQIANMSLNFGTTSYEQYMGNAGTYTKTMNLSKGKYIIAVLFEHQMANKIDGMGNNPAANQAKNNVISISCTSNNCIKQNISGYVYHPAAETSVFSNEYYFHTKNYLSLYYLEVKQNSDTISTTLNPGYSNTGLAELIAIQAIPLTIS